MPFLSCTACPPGYKGGRRSEVISVNCGAPGKCTVLGLFGEEEAGSRMQSTRPVQLEKYCLP